MKNSTICCKTRTDPWQSIYQIDRVLLSGFIRIWAITILGFSICSGLSRSFAADKLSDDFVNYLNKKETAFDEIEKSLNETVGKTLAEKMSKLVPVKSQISTHVLLWQIHQRFPYQLEEDALMLVHAKLPNSTEIDMIVYASRRPYSPGQNAWSFDAEQRFAFDGTPVQDWLVVSQKELEKPMFILRWVEERHFFEKISLSSSPLIQRVLFQYNWLAFIKRSLSEEERLIITSSNP